MLSRFTVALSVSMAVVGGKLSFLSGGPHDLWHFIFHRSFWFLGVVIVSTIATFLEVWERFLLMVVSFLFCF